MLLDLIFKCPLDLTLLFFWNRCFREDDLEDLQECRPLLKVAEK